MRKVLWAYYPEQLVKLILKTQLFKMCGNVPEGIYNKWRNIYSGKSSISQKEQRVWYLNHDQLGPSPLPVPVQWKLHSRRVHQRTQASLSPKDYGIFPRWIGHQHFSSCPSYLLQRGSVPGKGIQEVRASFFHSALACGAKALPCSGHAENTGF